MGNSRVIFQSKIANSQIGKDNLDLITQTLSDTIYDYFHRELGSVVNTSDAEFKDFSKHQLRKALKTLKSRNLENSLKEIRFVSKLLRRKISSTSTKKNLTITKLITTNRFTQDSGVIVRNISTKRRLCYHSLMYPHATCIIKKLFKCSDKSKQLNRPAWMPEYERPTVRFNNSPPTYQEITKIILEDENVRQSLPIESDISNCTEAT